MNKSFPRLPPALLARSLVALIAGSLIATAAQAAPVYIALGDSITFGETDLSYVGSLGNRGYVAAYADTLAMRNGGARPTVVNLAIDGETASSFMTGSGRTPPVMGRTDLPLQLENLNYDPNALVPQGRLFASTVAAQVAAGNTIQAITITLGFNELAALAALAPAQALALIPQTLANYMTSYGAVLSEIRTLAPGAALAVLGYYDPFPADPTSPAAPIFAAAGMELNAIIQQLASSYGATFVDTATSFVGHEAEYTYQDDMPANSSVAGPFGGVLPIGNVHPNALGYAVIAADVAAAVPEPSTWLLFGVGSIALLAAARRRVPKPVARRRLAPVVRVARE